MSNHKGNLRPNKRMSLLALLLGLLLMVGTLSGQLPWPGDNPAAPPSAATQAEAGLYTEPQAIADYLFAHGELPDCFLTKEEAAALGWDASRNDLNDVAPGHAIGGDRFGNYEGLLPSARGRTWREADCYYTGGDRGPYRIVYSSDGLVYYTADHYQSFTQLFPSKP